MSAAAELMYSMLKTFPFCAPVETPEEREAFETIPAFARKGYQMPLACVPALTREQLIDILKRATVAPQDADAVAHLLLAE